jgi:SecD/SecF fusion protein
MESYQVVLVLLAILALALLLGAYVSRSLRMPEAGWRVSLIAVCVGIAALILWTSWPPKQGIDLKGGAILIYEVDKTLTQQNAAAQTDVPAGAAGVAADSVDMPGLVQALSRRINPGGVQEIVVRRYGDDQVEIIVPDVTAQEVERVKKLITTGGFLKFLIVANERDHGNIWRLADEPAQAGQYEVRDANGKTVGQWVKLAIKGTVEEGKTPEYRADPPQAKSRVVRGRKEVLMVIDPDLALQGSHLANVRKGYEGISPAVFFDMTARGAELMGTLTSTNLPDTTANHYSLLGIVMDDELISSPRINSTITSSGIIEGDFSDEEVDLLVNVLRAGRLPAVLQEEPISQDSISPLLGNDTIKQGKTAITISLIAVVVFMIIYYRFAGWVAAMAVALNLVFTLALMIFIGAAFSLPGMAGMVLTVGMSVDANVLIFERIREELKAGAGIRTAIRNGFSRAFGTILDSNLTTAITALVLYWVGNEQLKSFAVTLILGIMTSIFTAVFCSHVVFDVAEKALRFRTLHMMQFFKDLRVDFFRLAKPATALSLILIAIGLGALAIRGNQIFDIDFLGGTSVQMLLKDKIGIAAVREKVDQLRKDGVAQDVAVTEVVSEEHGGERIYRIDSSLPQGKEQTSAATAIEAVQQSLVKYFGPALQMHSLSSTEPTAVAADAGAADASGLKSQSDLTFDERLNAETLEGMLKETARNLKMVEPAVVVENPDWDGRSSLGFKTWTVKTSLELPQAKELLSSLQTQLNAQPVWLSANQIGSSVAGDKTRTGLVAVFLSFLAIIGYVWFRFERISWGFAAVVALVHDVLVTVGAIALSYWLKDYLGFLMVDEFKISLPVLAAILTVIGYSINDTIVIFDRIREIKGKSPQLTVGMINAAVNQTMSRTILTAGTTLISIVILYAMGGQGVHSFAFAMLVGVVAGTYSSVYIAAPMLLWINPSGMDAPKPVEKAAV